MIDADRVLASERYAATRPPLHAAITRSSRYLTMRDGVRIAIDVHLPVGATATLPAIVRQTRYFRSLEPTWLARLLGERRVEPSNPRIRAYFVSRGYAWVDVDVRGSGASAGIWHSPWSPLEVKDGAEIVEWIIAQPWSNGRVGSTGNSYDGTAADLLASTGHPAIRAVAPRCSLYDVYTDVAFPGGLRQFWFTDSWTQTNQALDANRPERMVAEAIGQAHPRFLRGLPRRLLERALRLVYREVATVGGDRAAIRRALVDHVANLDVAAAARALEYRDDLQPTRLGPVSGDTFSPSAYSANVTCAVLGISGWFDAAYPHAAIKRHLTLADPRHRLLLGPWNHGCGMNMSPHAAQRQARFDLDAELLRFFDRHLLDRATGIEDESPVRYYVMGAEAWRTAPAWPPEHTTRTLYLGEIHTLRDTPSPAGHDQLEHAAAIGTGSRSRWRTLVSPFVVADYPDRHTRDAPLLVYESALLPDDLEIAGHPRLTLHVRPDAADGALFAYLEEHTRDGRVCYVTEGNVRIVHGVDDAAPPMYRSPEPHRTYRRDRVRPLVPTALAQVVFDLLPVAHRFAAGSRIRLALATGDADHFSPVPGGARRYQVERSAAHPSRLELPVTRT